MVGRTDNVSNARHDADQYRAIGLPSRTVVDCAKSRRRLMTPGAAEAGATRLRRRL